ncbi:MAG: DUF2147 domain-containing protein [Bacteroidetes bacterium]|nr:DUF2147 domain-containing protein [Bacteroidota bacterium]
MLTNHFFKTLLCSVFLVSMGCVAFAQDQIEHLWYNQEKTAKVQIYKATDGKFYGKIVWLKEPLRDGKPKVDDKNPNTSLRSQPLMGLVLLRGFVKDGTTGYEDGTIYDPKNGKTYSCKIKFNGNSLDVRGYIGISLIGRTANWTLVD